MKVLLWTRSSGKYDWHNEAHELTRVPTVGEYIAPGGDSWYLVQLVVHTPDAGDHAAEVYAMETKQDSAKLRAFRSMP